jgi:hypothetical protein
MASDPEQSLHDLSRRMPSPEEFQSFFESIADMDGRAAALILASLADNLLEKCIALQFVQLNPKAFERMFRNPGAPLGNFSSKIAVAYALRIINSETRSQLDRIRTIRNTFAHAMLTVTFDDPSIAAVCNKLDHNRLIPQVFALSENTPRGRYTVSTTFAIIQLLHHITGRLTQLRYGENPWRSEPLTNLLGAFFDLETRVEGRMPSALPGSCRA